MMDQRSESNLVGVNEKLVKVVRNAYTKTAEQDSLISFIVIEGLRSKERQAQLVAAGKSKTMNSMHLVGRAVDLAATVKGTIKWDGPLYSRLATIMKEAAKEEGIEIEWGGDWKSFYDGPHFQLSAKE